MISDLILDGRLEHLQKAQFPIYVTLFGILMLVSDLHHEKAMFPMFVILFGILMLVRDSHHEKASFPIFVTLLGILMLLSDLHFQKARSPIFVTPSGMMQFVSFDIYAISVVLSLLNKTWCSYINSFDSLYNLPFHPQNGLPFILTTLLGIIILVSDSHPENT